MTRVFARRVPGFDVDGALANIEDLALIGARRADLPHDEPIVGIRLETLVLLAERCATIIATPDRAIREPALVDACRTVVDVMLREIEGPAASIPSGEG